MANNEMDETQLEAADQMAMPEDNAKSLTGGLVITTTVVLLAAFVVMELALGKFFQIGMFKG